MVIEFVHNKSIIFIKIGSSDAMPIVLSIKKNIDDNLSVRTVPVATFS